MSQGALDFVPAPAPGIETYELDGERLLWHHGILHRLDPVGSLVWGCFDGKATVGDLARTLAEVFGTSEQEVQHDLVSLCTELTEEGLLRGGRSVQPDPPPTIRPGRPPTVPLDRDQELPYTSGRFLALDHDFGIRTDEARLAAYFDRALRSFAAGGPPARWYSVVRSTEPGERYRIYLDDEGLLAAPDADTVARYLLWHVNYEVINGPSQHLLIHAAGATTGERAVVLPGQMNAGKTTLVAGLVLDGFKFLTDELVALNLTTGFIDPFPRALNVEYGSWEALSTLRPADRDDENPLPQLVWHVDPTSIRPDAVAGSAPLRWVIAPQFEAGATTELKPMSRPEAVELLHRNAFNRHRVGAAGIGALVNAVQGVRCAQLVGGDLAEAVACIRRFIDDPEAPN